MSEQSSSTSRTKNPPYPKWLIGLTLASIAAVLLVFAFDGNDAPVHDHNDPTIAHDHAHGPEVAPAAPANAGLGDAVTDGDLTFTVVEMETNVPAIHGQDEFSVVPEASYTLIGLTVENTGVKPVRYFAEYATAIGADGDEVSSDYAAMMFANEVSDEWIADIAPGQEIPTIVVFDTDEELTAVVLREDAASHGVTVEL